MKLFLLLGLIFDFSVVFASPYQANKTIHKFNDAKKYLSLHLDLYENKTIYCSCSIIKKNVDLGSCGYKFQKDFKRASRVEWEHVVPAEAFGKSFIEWRTGTANCIRKTRTLKGRKCAETNAEYNRMESDLYNLFPEIGELNGLRSNYSMAALTESARDFGGCKVKLLNRKFEPQDSAKGIVARTYFNFENRYPKRGIVSNKNKLLFEAWDKMYPVTEVECRRWKRLEQVNGYTHLFASRCRKLD